MAYGCARGCAWYSIAPAINLSNMVAIDDLNNGRLVGRLHARTHAPVDDMNTFDADARDLARHIVPLAFAAHLFSVNNFFFETTKFFTDEDKQ
jgi:hypothetical protein